MTNRIRLLGLALPVPWTSFLSGVPCYCFAAGGGQNNDPMLGPQCKMAAHVAGAAESDNNFYNPRYSC